MKRFVSLAILILIGAGSLQAQDKNSTVTEVSNGKLVYMQQLQQFSNNALRANNRSTNGNLTIVQQIGNNNSVTAQTVSGAANRNYLQIGDANSIESYSNINRVSEQIIQEGNNNDVLNYSVGPVNNATLNLYQSGNNLSFQKFGTNSQTNNLGFRFTGDNRTIIVRSN